MNRPILSHDDAQRISAAASAFAEAKGWPVSIAILDHAGHLLMFQRLDGANLGSVDTSIAKARTALLFDRPTKALEDAIAGGRIVLASLPQATPIQGGLPIRDEGALIGSVGVSGVLSPQDEEIAQAGIDAL